MKKFKKIISIICALTLVASMTSCGKKATEETSGENGVEMDANVTKSGELPIVKEKEKLTIGVIGTPKVQDYATNAFTKYLEEKTNIDLDFYIFPTGGGMEKLNVMLGSGSQLPDVIVGFNIKESTFLQQADLNTFVNLSPYIDKYGFYTNKMFETAKLKDMRKYMTCSNGNIYYLPSYVEQQGNAFGGKAWINKKWLDKLGLKMPTTTEEFQQVMEAFKTKDPNGNGKNDEIGFTGSKDGWNESPMNFLTNSFVYDDYSKLFTVTDDHKVNLAYMQPEFKKAAKYVSTMVKDGTFDIQSLTQDNATLKSVAQMDDNIIGAFASGSPDMLFSNNMERLADYVALPPLTGPEGKAYAYKNPNLPKCAGVVTKYCKNKLAAFRFLDFMLSEEASTFARYGVEGTDWTPAKEGDVGLFENIGVKAKINQILAYGVEQNSHWMQFHPQYRPSELAEGIIWNKNKLDGEYIKAQALDKYMGKEPKNLYIKQKFTSEETEEYNSLATDIGAYASENIAMFISGRRDVDKDWDKFISELKSMDVERYIELAQMGYDNFRKE